MRAREFTARRRREASTAVVLTSTLLTVCVLGSSSGIVAAGAPASGTSVGNWAYGWVHTQMVHGAAGHFAWTGHATFGFAVVFNETENSSTGGITLHVERTVGAAIQVQYCRPDCTAPTVKANFSFRAWETTDAWANLTTHATVTEGGTSVAALGLVNSSVRVTARLDESGFYRLGTTLERARTLSVNVSGNAAVQLTPALGLVPLSLTPGATWNSSSVFVAAGGIAWNYHYRTAGLLVALPLNVTPNGSVPFTRAGTVDLAGAYSPGTAYAYGGAENPAVNLTLSGVLDGFSLVEGVALVPAYADLFGSSALPWSPVQGGTAVLTTSRVDLRPGVWYDHHLGILASSYQLLSGTTNVAASALAPGGSGPLPSGALPAAATNSTPMQATPESVGSAQAQQACLVTGRGCPGLGGPTVPVRLILLVGAAAVATLLVVATVGARRRPARPAYPNATLYPPGAVSGTPRPAPPPPPAEDDPLSHLW